MRCSIRRPLATMAVAGFLIVLCNASISVWATEASEVQARTALDEALVYLEQTIEGFRGQPGTAPAGPRDLNALRQAITRAGLDIASLRAGGHIDHDTHDKLQDVHKALKRSLNRLGGGNFDGAFEHARASEKILFDEQ